MKKMYKKLCYMAGIVAVGCFVQTALAAPPIPVGQTNYLWTGAGDGTSWSDPANWNWQSYDANTNLYSGSGIVPPANSTTFDDAIGTGYPTATPTPITIGASDVVSATDQLFGPEWGETLDIYGTVNTGFGFAPVGDAANPSVVNMYGNSSLTTGDSIFLGDMFWFAGGPYVTVNMYDNSQMTTSYLAVGGHLNIYGGTVTVNSALLTGTATAGAWGSTIVTDSTRLIDVAGGELIVYGDATTQANDLISRGVLEGDGVVGQVNIDTTSMAGYTIITAVPEPASMALLGLGGLALILRRRLVS